MKRKKHLIKKQARKQINFILLLAIFVIGVGAGILLKAEDSLLTRYSIQTKEAATQVNLAAIDSQGNGVAVPIKVEIKPGTGKILTNIEKLLFWVDTQQSIQTAKEIAENYTQTDMSQLDILYSIETNRTGIIGGPSAGGALAIATIAAMENRTVRPDVMMTGTINPDGTIGKVGGVLAKAGAAKDIGAKVFIVPKGEGYESKITPEQSCDKVGNFIFCETTYKEQQINIGEKIGIAIVEVGTIEDAVKYFFEGKL